MFAMAKYLGERKPNTRSPCLAKNIWSPCLELLWSFPEYKICFDNVHLKQSIYLSNHNINQTFLMEKIALKTKATFFNHVAASMIIWAAMLITDIKPLRWKRPSQRSCCWSSRRCFRQSLQKRELRKAYWDWRKDTWNYTKKIFTGCEK